MKFGNKLAIERWREFKESKCKYQKGAKKIHRILNNNLSILIGEVILNIFKILTDTIQKIADRFNRVNLGNLNIKVYVQSRNDLTHNRTFLRLEKLGDNKNIMKHLAEEELYTEISCCHFLRIEGLLIKHFRHLMKVMGENPWAFLSGDRKENGGRLVIDNKFINSKHPFLNPDNPIYSLEEKFWQKIFPNAPEWAFWSKWYMSRTHAPIYVLKKDPISDVILLPIHIDPKNGMAIFKKPNPGEKGVWEYHQLTQTSTSNYVGTGLYDLGCKYFIYLMRMAKSQGIINHLEIYGEKKLETSGSIVLDDKFTDELVNLA